VWDLLRREKDLVITSNGKPVAVLTAADESILEDVLATLRQGRARAAVADLRRVAVRRGLDRLADEKVEAIVTKARRPDRRKAAGGARG
jgi:prevent-host-death family protein